MVITLLLAWDQSLAVKDERNFDLHIAMESDLPGVKRVWIGWCLLYQIFQTFLTVIHKKLILHCNPLTHTHKQTHTHKKIFLTITTHDLHIHIFSILLFSSITSLKYCFHITDLISWYLMRHELQLGKYSPRPYSICTDTVKSLSEKNGAT